MVEECILGGIPEQEPATSSAWAEKNVGLPGSARSEKFEASITPWIIEPLESVGGGECRMVTFVKPVQCGGSVAGEVAILRWISSGNSGDICYNWPSNEKALDRWDKRFERTLKACPTVMARAPEQARHVGKWSKGTILFPHCNFVMQGVWSAGNLDSDSVRYEVNEEVHDWESGRLAKAINRTTAVWNACIFNVSNAGKKGDQLHRAMMEGTNQVWQVKCPDPGCGKFHDMQTEWNLKKPHLGGLRYDAEGCRLPDGGYDYNKLGRTIRYQMPCGFEVKDQKEARKALSKSGRYSDPRNPGALKIDRSYTLDAVAVDYIPWLTLIQEKHAALLALRHGDPEPWKRYLQERECRFWDPEDRPVVGRVILNRKLKKNRDGLLNRKARFAALDRQQGSLRRGELPHWWCVIRDFDADANSLLVFEGKLLNDEDAADVIERHSVLPACVAVDSGDDTTHVYQFCLRHGFSAIKGAAEASFSHPDGARRIFSVERPLHLMLNRAPVSEDPFKEPLFWHYSKSGIRERLHWLRGTEEIKWETPGDVSEDYQSHMESEELQERKTRTGETIQEWVQIKTRNDLFVCECYIAMLADMAGLIGGAASREK